MLGDDAVANQVGMGMLPDNGGALAATVKDGRMARWFAEADTQLAKTRYLSGDECALCDFALFPVVNQRRAWVDEAKLANLATWCGVVGARQGVQKGLSESS